ncbi:hypothetical protein H9M94_00055 [Mycoplasma sp. Pen4]|uniref:HinT-interacting membrane complex lipoprotein P60 n=1 Tax=Mycoplasma sp. Pen4 TaxID=640330 RepID=UPI001654136A|nr:hypothetical protein [Mycoplasma sp. Pen4]QNM93659.1 hypothetical protein H9M94_00055 [Mycoplasma sp. Pen4]
MTKIFKKLSALIAPVAIASPIVAVSCAQTVDTEEKIKQDALFKNNVQMVRNQIENKWLVSTLESLYKTETNNTDDKVKEAILADGFKVYTIFLANKYNLENDPLYLKKQYNTWKSLALFNTDQAQKLASLDQNAFQGYVTQEQFNILYNVDETGVANIANRVLLSSRFLLLNNEKDLNAIDAQTYEKYKNQYDLASFNLINYILGKKIVQLWQYESSNQNDVFTTAQLTIKNIEDYTNLIKNSPSAIVTPGQNLLLNERATFERTLGGYKGLKPNPFNIDYSYDTLKDKTSNDTFVGFYNPVTKEIVKVNEDGTLVTPIKTSDNNSKIVVSYLSQIAPIGKDFEITNAEGKKETIKKLSFEGTPYADKTTELSILLALYDDSLFKTVQEAFTKLGYTVKVDEKSLVGDATKDLPYVVKEQ